MYCKNCGAVLTDNAVVCTSCGTQQQSAAAPQTPTFYASPSAEIRYVIPEENRPLSPWAYFGLQILFAVPVVGFVFLIIFSCSGSNINRRNFARSYWCTFIIIAAIMFFIFLLGIAGGGWQYTSDAWQYI